MFVVLGTLGRYARADSLSWVCHVILSTRGNWSPSLPFDIPNAIIGHKKRMHFGYSSEVWLCPGDSRSKWHSESTTPRPATMKRYLILGSEFPQDSRTISIKESLIASTAFSTPKAHSSSFKLPTSPTPISWPIAAPFVVAG